MSMIDKMVQLL